MRRFLAVLSLGFVLLAGCSKKATPIATLVPATTSPTAAPSGTPTPSASATAASSSDVTFHAYNLKLDTTSDQGNERFAGEFDAAGPPLTVTLHGTNGTVRLCALPAIDSPPSASGCSKPTDGTPATVELPAFSLDIAAGSVTLDEVTVSYLPTDRKMDLRLPNIVPQAGASACKDNGCNPFFELTPFGAGTLKATADWDGIATGKLILDKGAVAAHDYSAHGHPYDELDSDQGSSDQGPANLHVSASVDATEVAVVLEDQGGRPLRTPSVKITWP